MCRSRQAAVAYKAHPLAIPKYASGTLVALGRTLQNCATRKKRLHLWCSSGFSRRNRRGWKGSATLKSAHKGTFCVTYWQHRQQPTFDRAAVIEANGESIVIRRIRSAVVLVGSIVAILSLTAQAAPLPTFTPTPSGGGNVLSNQPYPITACFDNLSASDPGYAPTLQVVVPAGSTLSS